MPRSKSRRIEVPHKAIAAERFGIGVNIDVLADLIQQNRGTFVEASVASRDSLGCGIQGRVLRVALSDKKRGMPVTMPEVRWMGKQTQ